jgi:hypothetical protein
MAEQMQTEVFKYMVRANGSEYYCKVTELIMDNNAIYTFSFGGKGAYCFTASMSSKNNYIPYITNVEFNSECIKDGVLKNTVDLVKAALWTMKRLFKHIDKFTLMDDSHIICDLNNRLYKLSLAYDYILKRNKTWYQYHFKASLPGSVTNSNSILGLYTKSLDILDEPCEQYKYIITHVPAISNYKEAYISATSPRTFVKKLRDIYGENYCKEVYSWLSLYMSYIGVKLYKEDWFINASDVTEPNNYELFTSTIELRGGEARRIRRRRRKAKGTRRKVKIIGHYGLPDFD